MKKVIGLLVVLMLLFSMALTCFAIEEPLSVNDAKAAPGDVVYLTLVLHEKTVGNAMGVSTVYDSKILEPVPASSSWKDSALLKDFNEQGAGVWAVESPKDLQGTVCVLAFRVKENAVFTSTTVECTLIVKKNGQDAGEFTAEAVISQDCNHSYSAWKDVGLLGHSRSCSNCNAAQTESHSWNEGVVSPKPGDSKTNLMTYTCQVCGATNVKEFAASGEQPAAPTVPEETRPGSNLPTAPFEPPTPPTRPPQEDSDQERAPTVPIPTYPANNGGNPGSSGNQTGSNPGSSDNQSGSRPGTSGNQQGNSNPNGGTNPGKDNGRPPENPDDHSGHSHDLPTAPPIAVPIGSGNNGQAPTEHVHTENELVHEHEPQEISAATVCVVVGAMALIMAAAMYFVKKKR